MERRELRPAEGARAGGGARLLCKAAGEQFDDDGWFDTGDVAHIDLNGYMQITDRAKDVIKSGGEWISSIDSRTSLSAIRRSRRPPSIGVPHSRWAERPLLVVVRKPGKSSEQDRYPGFHER